MIKDFLRNVVCCCSLLAAIGCGGSQVVDFPLDHGTAGAGGSSNLPDAGQPDAGSCRDENCPVGEVCVNDQCTPVDECDGVCCPSDSECVQGVCQVLDPCSQITCPSNSECVDGICQYNCPPPPDPCADVKCCEGTVCRLGRCEKIDPCENVECPSGKTCKLGECVCDGHAPSIPDEYEHCQSGKSLVCHYAHGNKHNICVDDHAVPAHLKHGDKLVIR